MKILVFAGSLRKGSYNKRFAREAMRLLAGRPGVETEFVDLQPLAIPVYDGDLEEASGVPAGVKTLSDKILAADALLISTPEYNGSIPGILKNTVDWLSRLKPVSLSGKHLLMIAASPGALGGIRSLWHSRQPFEVLGTHVFPEVLALPLAHQAFDEGGKLKDPKLAERLSALLDRYVAHARKA
ncbi:MAG TPA: NAD(P)H-dependent oxidoreductase [Elusimicrobiota bacterium]|nr:NAD(P)H-dependent oxidoreductase [Elusimicrobiota bacterium]